MEKIQNTNIHIFKQPEGNKMNNKIYQRNMIRISIRTWILSHNQSFLNYAEILVYKKVFTNSHTKMFNTQLLEEALICRYIFNICNKKALKKNWKQRISLTSSKLKNRTNHQFKMKVNLTRRIKFLQIF